MKKIALYLSFFVLAAMVTMSSCKRGNSILTVGSPTDKDFTVFDTLDLPTSRYYFYGKFDGQYKMWQNDERSKWDTATRIGPEGEEWTDWDEYFDNIYYNFTETEEAYECGPDSNSSFLACESYFIRPEDPYQRLEIFFFDCIDLADTTNPFWPDNQLDLFNMGANPFSSPVYARNGIKVKYIDENLEIWETQDGSGQLIDNYFRVTNTYLNDTNANPTDTFALYIVEGEFAGRLYNGEESRTVLDAKFRVRVLPREPL